jgi:hypothetical protein
VKVLGPHGILLGMTFSFYKRGVVYKICSRSLININFIKFIPKVSDLESITNWRLITLLNVSCKVIVKYLALQIHYILPQIIRLKKMGFIRGQSIFDNVVVVFEVMEWAKYLGLKAFFIKLDFANSYEHVEWPFIVAMLHALGFGHLFV